MKHPIHKLLIALAMLSAFNPRSSRVLAQGTTAFTYQGQLRDGGTNANGTYTIIFKLYDALTSGNQIGAAITNSPTLFNGLFSLNLDFGAGAFNGSARWLDITITNDGVTQTLSPRVQILPAPYAHFAAIASTVTNGAIMSPQLAANAVSANNIASGQVVKTFNGLTDAVVLAAGSNVTLTTNGNTLTIAAAGGGGGGVVVTNTLKAGNNVGLFTNNGIVQISSFVPNIQVFRGVTNATFTVPTNVTKIMVEMWGAGGGGGAGNSSGGTIGGGGGGGAYALNVFTSLTPGSSYLVTAGAGGDGGIEGGASGKTGASSSFGTLLSAGGGSGGSNATISSNGNGGSGGNATGSIVNAQGSSGSMSGNSGGSWRGSPGEPQGGGLGNGPGGGGAGGGPGNGGPASPGDSGNSGAVIVYY